MAEVIPIGSDHAGFEPLDVGTHDTQSVDYPDYAHDVAGRIERHEVARGVLLCGSGLGMAYAANRHHGVRAAVAWSRDIARLARAHNDANVLVLPARFVSEGEGVDIMKAWLRTEFEGGRHNRRVAKIDQEQG